MTSWSKSIRRLQDYLSNPVMAFHLWVRQIAKDRIIGAHRRHRAPGSGVDREQPLAQATAPDQSTIEPRSALRDPELTPRRSGRATRAGTLIQAAIELLDERDRDVILMRHYEQLSNQEIATALEITEPAASMRYLRALKRLRGKLDATDH
ncbi:MAG: sigma-70 family RNA polymerase sigma factor [Pirellulaceae bacterium]